MTAESNLLRQLAGLYGIQTAYHSIDGEWKPAETETLISILRALGAPLAGIQDMASARRECRQQRWRRILEPVTVAWDGKLETITLRLPESLAGARVNGHIFLEGGAADEFNLDLHGSSNLRRVELEGNVYVEKRVPLAFPLLTPFTVPHGYHRLVLEFPGNRSESLIISAPQVAYQPDTSERGWGAFIPLYSLHSKRGWAAGDIGDMRRLVDWVAGLGGKAVASLPLLTTFLGQPFEPSPYLPVSKLFWSEFYTDLDDLPEMNECPSARQLLAQTAASPEAETLHELPLVDYYRQMALKRPVLEEVAHCLGENVRQSAGFQDYLRERPEADRFASFRAAVERHGTSWPQWPERQRMGDLQEGDYDHAVFQYYSCAQYLAHESMRRMAEFAAQRDVRLYLDLPLGVHPDGYDTWRHRDLFVNGVTVGAPPDAIFVRGQNWAFPPLHPEKLRESGYRYFIDCLRHHLRRASTLRIDHVMSFHRLFYIPTHAPPGEGMYVRYHPEEIYAIASLESHRHKAVIVGEDLGIVPTAVHAAMKRHGLQRMYVLHYELAAPANPLLSDPPADAVASINTHDMPPFASFWTGQDITERKNLGILNDYTARQETVYRAIVKNRLAAFLKKAGWLEGGTDAAAVLKACLRFLSSSNARLVLVNLEDLWLETHVHNYPSTSTERPNWRQRARHDFDTFCKMPQVTSILEEVDRLRKSGHDGAGRKTREGRKNG